MTPEASGVEISKIEFCGLAGDRYSLHRGFCGNTCRQGNLAVIGGTNGDTAHTTDAFEIVGDLRPVDRSGGTFFCAGAAQHAAKAGVGKERYGNIRRIGLVSGHLYGDTIGLFCDTGGKLIYDSHVFVIRSSCSDGVIQRMASDGFQTADGSETAFCGKFAELKKSSSGIAVTENSYGNTCAAGCLNVGKTIIQRLGNTSAVYGEAENDQILGTKLNVEAIDGNIINIRSFKCGCDLLRYALGASGGAEIHYDLAVEFQNNHLPFMKKE